MESQAEQQALITKRLDQAMEWILRRTVPLFAHARGGIPVLEGSGVLLQIADSRFVITAAHVLAGILKDGRALLFGTEGGIFSLEGCEVRVSDDREDIDVALIELPMKEISPSKSFIRLCEVDVGRHPPLPGSYAVLGFPRGLRTLDPATNFQRPDPYWILGDLYDGTSDQLTVGTSIAIEFTPHTFEDYKHERARHPALQGISGCGIWRVIGAADGTPGINWDPSTTIRLAGIEHGLLESAIKGVLAFRAIDAIGQLWPKLRPAIELHRSTS